MRCLGIALVILLSLLQDKLRQILHWLKYFHSSAICRRLLKTIQLISKGQQLWGGPSFVCISFKKHSNAFDMLCFIFSLVSYSFIMEYVVMLIWQDLGLPRKKWAHSWCFLQINLPWIQLIFKKFIRFLGKTPFEYSMKTWVNPLIL